MENKLERRYGLFTAICMVVGIVIGSGVFFKAQTILQKTRMDYRRDDHDLLYPRFRSDGAEV